MKNYCRSMLIIMGFLLIHEVEAGEQELFGSHVIITDTRIDALRDRIENRTEPTFSAWQQVRQKADRAMEELPSPPQNWYVPGYYRDAKGHSSSKRPLMKDANNAYLLGLAYRITGEERYAAAAERNINAWATAVETLSREDDSTLSFSYHFPAMIFAADLIRDYKDFTEEEQGVFRKFVREKALPQHTMNRANNWGNWGLVLVMASAVYLRDQQLFEQSVERWKEFIETQIAEDGHLPHEGHRNEGRSGIWYSNFTLYPQTIAAEIARVNGVFLYDYQSPGGRTLRKAFERLASWAAHPETFPYYQGDSSRLHGADYVSYFEILNQLWHNESAQKLLEDLRPLDGQHCLPALSFTHGDLFEMDSASGVKSEPE
jgi:hypothetical protein